MQQILASRYGRFATRVSKATKLAAWVLSDDAPCDVLWLVCWCSKPEFRFSRFSHLSSNNIFILCSRRVGVTRDYVRSVAHRRSTHDYRRSRVFQKSERLQKRQVRHHSRHHRLIIHNLRDLPSLEACELRLMCNSLTVPSANLPMHYKNIMILSALCVFMMIMMITLLHWALLIIKHIIFSTNYEIWS